MKRMKPLRLKSIIFALLISSLLLITSICQGEVNSKTGAYFVSVDDVDDHHSGNFAFTRTYNSDNKESGMFGAGWSTPFEKRLRCETNALVLYDRCRREYVRYVPSGDTVLTKDTTLSSIPLGATFTNVRAKCRMVVRTEGGFTHSCTGKDIERFNGSGEIITIVDDDEVTTVHRAGSGRIDAIEDHTGHRITFAYNDEGMVKEMFYEGKNLKTFTYRSGCLRAATSEKGAEENYLYGQNDELVALNTGSGNEFVYYESDGDHRVTCVKQSTGGETSYRYEIDPADPGHTTTRSLSYDEPGMEVGRTFEQFFYNVEVSGDRWLTRTVVDQDGAQTVTELTRSGTPLLIESGNDKVVFKYDTEGRLVFKIDRHGVVTELEYESRHGKVSRITKRFQDTADKQSIITFIYDAQGQLIQAEGSDGRKVDLSYSSYGMMSKLITGNRTVQITYNKQKKMERIAVKGMGELRVRYTSTGEVDTVRPKSGSRKISLVVVSLFEVLTGLIGEAKISLTLY